MRHPRARSRNVKIERPESSVFVCQQHLEQIRPVLRAVLACLNAAPTQTRLSPDMIEAALRGECVQCGIRLSGQELLASVADCPTLTPKLQRLRQGYCARHGCNSYYYRLSFAPIPGVDWPAVLQRVDLYPGGALSGAGTARSAAGLAELIGARQVIAGGAMLALLAAAWVAGQCYFGGTIPLLREPENFQVDRFGADLLQP